MNITGTKKQLVLDYLDNIPSQEDQDQLVKLFTLFRDGRKDTQAQIRLIMAKYNATELLVQHTDGSRAYIKQSNNEHKGYWGSVSN